MHHQGAMDPQHAERFSQFFHQVEGIHAHHLGRSPRRIRKRTEQIENCSQPKLAAGRLHIFHGRMHGRREQKHNADFFETPG